jgi:poly-gamma-glutamate capsule biosynthesis protein CapA/YwtB (metallophosphatase superfamily)
MSVGDFYLTRSEPTSVFGDTADMLRQADLLFVNQEVPITDRGTPFPGIIEAGMACLRAPLRSVEALTALGVSGVTFANNHGVDYGPEGLLHAIAHLEAHGIPSFGAGADEAMAFAPHIVVVEGVRVASLGFTTVFPHGGLANSSRPGLAGIRIATAYETSSTTAYQPGSPSVTITFPDQGDVQRMEQCIIDARAATDLVVVQFHWGVAGQWWASGYMEALGHAAVDAGADLVVGNHPHVLMGVEMYRGVPIYYNLNHFAFDLTTPPSWVGRDDAIVVLSTIEGGQFIEHSVVPIAIDPDTHDVCLARGARRNVLVNRFRERSTRYGTVLDDTQDDLLVTVAEGQRRLPPPDLRVQTDPPAILAQAWDDCRDIMASKLS